MSKPLGLSPMAKQRLGLTDAAVIEQRALAMGATVAATYYAREREWVARASRNGTRVELRAKGPLAPVLAGVLDDLETVA